MAKSSHFVCQSCGAVSSKWSGRCDNCGEWNSIIEEAAGILKHRRRKERTLRKLEAMETRLLRATRGCATERIEES